MPERVQAHAAHPDFSASGSHVLDIVFCFRTVIDAAPCFICAANCNILALRLAQILGNACTAKAMTSLRSGAGSQSVARTRTAHVSLKHLAIEPFHLLLIDTIYNAWDGGMKDVDIYFFPCPRCGDPAGQVRDQVEYLAKYNITSRYDELSNMFLKMQS